MTQRETPTMPRVAAALFGVALGLAAGGLAFQFIEPERLYSPVLAHASSTPEPSQHVALAFPAPTDRLLPFPNDNSFGLGGRQKAELSSELSSSSVGQRRNVEKRRQAIPVPAYLLHSASARRPYHREAAFAPKGDLGHEYWRAMIGGSHVIERYQHYLSSHPSGIVADTAVNRIRELEQAAEKATSTKLRQRVAKLKKRQSTSKQTKPETVQTIVALSVKETDTVQCGDQRSSKCRKPLQTPAKDCSSSMSQEGVCVRKNYRTSTVIKR
jgi:hypothetical protein